VPRAPRLQFPGGVYHVITRGNRRQPIFVSRGDAPAFLGLVARVVRILGWRCHDFCLMPNHYHAVVETPNPDLAVGMQRLNGVYAKWFNHHHGVEGHLFERRYRAIVIETDGQLLAVCRYLALNPVAAGLCSHPAEWPWSSYRAMVGLEPPPEFLTCDWILSLFGAERDSARAAFSAFIAGDMPEPNPGAWHRGSEEPRPDEPSQPKP
jgi:putative transposase